VINLLEENPVNIAGVIFTAQPDKVEEVAAELAAFPGAEVHVTGENGNMVVTIEETLSKEDFVLRNKPKESSNEISFKKKPKNKKDHGLIGTITSMSNVPGVISSSLVFHHNDAGLPQHQEEKK
jgi:nitrate reductase NapD